MGGPQISSVPISQIRKFADLVRKYILFLPTYVAYNALIKISVVDPYSFFTDPDPDPELDVGDQYGSGSNPIRIQGFNDQKLKKYYSWNFFLFFYYQKLQVTYP